MNIGEVRCFSVSPCQWRFVKTSEAIIENRSTSGAAATDEFDHQDVSFKSAQFAKTLSKKTPV